MPGIWLISALFFASSVFWGWNILFLGVPFYLLLLFVFLRKRIRVVFIPILVSTVLWSSVGAIIYKTYPKDIKKLIPPKTVFTLHGVARTLDPANHKKLFVEGKKVTLYGKTFPFPYSFWVLTHLSQGWGRDLIGSYVGITVYFTGKSFFMIPGMIAKEKVWYGGIYRFFYFLRQGGYELFSRLSLDARTFLSAVILGIKDVNYYKLKEILSEISSTHILAISGLHLMIICGFLFFGMRMISIPYIVAVITTMIFILCYMFLVPDSPSLLRAGVMFLLYMISVLLKRKWSIYDILGLTVFIVFLISPQQLFSLGFRFSFISVLSILLGFSLTEKRSFTDIWLIGMFVSFGLAPIVIKYFGCYSLVSWVISPVLLVLLTLILILGIIYLFTFGFVGAPVINFLVDLLIDIAKLFKGRSVLLCYSDITDKMIMLYYAILLLFVLFMGVYLMIKEEKKFLWN